MISSLQILAESCKVAFYVGRAAYPLRPLRAQPEGEDFLLTNSMLNVCLHREGLTIIAPIVGLNCVLKLPGSCVVQAAP